MSLTQRLPIELWIAIFEYVLDSWLFPRPDASIITLHKVFQHGCITYVEYQRVQRIRTRLQLVCQAWNTALQSLSIRNDVAVQDVTSARFDSPYVSSAARLDLEPVWVCECSSRSDEKGFYEPWRALMAQRMALFQQSMSAPEDNGQQTLRNVRVLNAWNFPLQMIPGLCEGRPPLQSLSIYLPALHESVGVCRYLLDNLTHLHLRQVFLTPGIPLIHLPKVCFLDIELQHIDKVGIPLKLPRLTKLVITYHCSSDTLPPEIHNFIVSFSSKLTDLVLLGYQNMPFVLFELIPLLPRLQLYGTGAHFTRCTIGLLESQWAECGKVDTLVIYGIERKCGDMLKCLVALFLSRRPFKSLRIPLTWAEFIHEAQQMRSHAMRRIFAPLYSMSVPIFDADGVGLAVDHLYD